MIKTFNLYVTKGDDYSKELVLDYPLEQNAVVQGQFRKNYDSSFFTDLDVSTLDSSNGTIRVQLPAIESGLLKTGSYLASISIVDTPITIEGILILSSEGIRSAVTIHDTPVPTIPIGSDGVNQLEPTNDDQWIISKERKWTVEDIPEFVPQTAFTGFRKIVVVDVLPDIQDPETLYLITETTP